MQEMTELQILHLLFHYQKYTNSYFAEGDIINKAKWFEKGI
jgi:hypothetical protein